MKAKRLILAVLFGVALAASSQPADDQQDKAKPVQTEKRVSPVGTVPNQQRGPSFSSPMETMHPNGDRDSHYPPYYRPEPSGGGQN